MINGSKGIGRIAVFFLLVISPVLAILLALLGYKTLDTNPLGWFLLLVGIVYASGVVIVYWIRKERFWESHIRGDITHEERGDFSYWLITASLVTEFYMSPSEYLFFTAILPRTGLTKAAGLGLVILGSLLLVLARRTLGDNYSGHVSVKEGQALIQSGLYRFIRHPAYAGYLCIALGLSLGYSSLVGLLAFLILMLPSLIYRIKAEEILLIKHFGDAYLVYSRGTKRLIPGIW